MITLPHPADYPAAAVLIYDGHCKFCGRQVQRIARLDRKKQLAFLSLHDPLVEEQFPSLCYQELMDAMHLVEPSGTVHRGAAAFRFLTRLLPPLWPLMPVLHLPFSLPLWQAIYRFIARRRMSLNCDKAGCQVHVRK